MDMNSTNKHHAKFLAWCLPILALALLVMGLVVVNACRDWQESRDPCVDCDFVPELPPLETIREWYIGPELEKCSFAGKMCYVVNGEHWNLEDVRVKGFEWEQGYHHIIRVNQFMDTPTADGRIYGRWQLIELVWKDKEPPYPRPTPTP